MTHFSLCDYTALFWYLSKPFHDCPSSDLDQGDVLSNAVGHLAKEFSSVTGRCGDLRPGCGRHRKKRCLYMKISVYTCNSIYIYTCTTQIILCVHLTISSYYYIYLEFVQTICPEKSTRKRKGGEIQ